MKRLFAVVLILAVVGCLSACDQQTQPEKITAATVDEFLTAIEPGATIYLAEGEYCLSDAADYGRSGSPYYTWNDLGLGQYELQLQDLDGLTVIGAGKDKTTLVTEPRWANVLGVQSCKNLTLQDMTLGHTEMTEACEGGVLRIYSSVDTALKDLGLFGCGTLGVLSYKCNGLEVQGCDVYDCSIGGMQLSYSDNIHIFNSSFRSLGKEMPVSHVFDIAGCENVTVSECSISENYVHNLMQVSAGGNIVFRSNRIERNRISSGMYLFHMPGVVLDGNEYDGNVVRNWYAYDSLPAVDASGREVVFEEPAAETLPVTPGVAAPVSTGEQREVRVSTVEEFLEAIGSDTCIILEAELLDFSTSEEYQTLMEHSDDFMADDPSYYPMGTLNRYWMNEYDGPSLIIYDVTNLTIKAEGEDRRAHTLSAVPRYADVLTFENCSGITLSGFTAGHTIEPGQCTGGVFRLLGCEDVLIENCGMYGCGTEGVCAEDSRNIQIVNSEIYECSYTGIDLNSCDNVAISGTLIRDIRNEWQGEAPHFSFYNSRNITLDGEALDGNYIGS